MVLLSQTPKMMARAEIPQIAMPNSGPVVIPTEIFVRGLIAVMLAYTSLLIFLGKWIWGKRKDELAIIKADLSRTNTQIAENLENTDQLYENHRAQTNEMITKLGEKVDRHHETVMTMLLQIHERRNGAGGRRPPHDD